MSATLTDQGDTARPPAPRGDGWAPGPEPRSVPGARAVGAVLSLLLLGLAVVAGREALVAWGGARGGSWLPGAAEAVATVGTQWWVLPAGAVLLLAGLALVLAALRPRRRRHLALGDDGRVWLSASGLGRLARATVRDLPGVLDVRTTASRRSLRLQVVTTAPGTDEVRVQVTDRVRELLTDVRPQPRLRVRVRTGGTR